MDIGDQKISTVGGAMSSRIPMTIVGEDGRERKGFFTKSAFIQTDKELAQLFDRVEQEFPEQKELWDFIKTLDKSQLDSLAANCRLRMAVNVGSDLLNKNEKEIVIPQTAEDCEKYALAGMKAHLGKIAPPELVEKVSAQPDFIRAMDSFASDAFGFMAVHRMYVAPGAGKLHVQEGANIDKRNAAMTTVANLIGRPQIIARSQPLIVNMDGVAVTGTFMETAHGENLDDRRPDNPIRTNDAEVYDSPVAFDDMASLHVLDFICGNIDRHPGNFFLRFDEIDGKLKLVGVTGIDNDMSLGTFVPAKNQRGTIKFPHPQDFGVIGGDLANTILLLDEATLSEALKGYSLSQEEISAENKPQAQIRQELIKANREIMLAAQVYMKGKKSWRFQENGQKRFANAVDAVAIVGKHTPGARPQVDKLLARINDVRGVTNSPEHRKHVSIERYGAERARNAANPQQGGNHPENDHPQKGAGRQ